MEGIPVALMEAMAAGVPVLSTYHSGIPELVDHGVTGLLAPEKDHVQIAENICRLIDEPALSASLTESARRKVEREFNQASLWGALAGEIQEELT
jgi:colanic acid/amylovoran biosynthesis glycosyltransferase